MMFKKTITASGTQVQDVAAALNAGLKDFLTGTGLFQLISVENGHGDWPKYTLKHQNTDYCLTLQSRSNTVSVQIVAGVIRGSLDESAYEKNISYGSVANARITIHIITSGGSFAYKIFSHDGTVALGGSCLRYTKFSGEQGYMYHAREDSALLGHMGRYEMEEGMICQISYSEYPYTEYAIIQELPVIQYSGAAIGYADDIAVISASRLSDSLVYSVYRLADAEYYGGQLAHGQYNVSSHISSCAAIAMKAN